MVEISYTGEVLWARIERAVENVKDRLRRVTESLNQAGMPWLDRLSPELRARLKLLLDDPEG